MSPSLEIFLTFYLMIGFANFAAHILRCPGCKETLAGTAKLLAIAVVEIFDWPLRLYQEIRNLFRDKMIARITGPDGKVHEILGEPGESTAEFEIRVLVHAELIKKGYEKFFKGPGDV